MCDQHYYQYAFARADCCIAEIGAGIDPRFDVELICNGPVAAVASRIGLDQFDLAKLQGNTATDVTWLGQVATRHNEIICQAARSSAVLPLRMGTVFRSRDSLQAALGRHRTTVAEFLRQLGDRQEWGIKLYRDNRRPELEEDRSDLPRSGPKSASHKSDLSPLDPAHRLSPSNRPAEQSGREYLARKKAELENHRECQAGVQQTIQAVEQRLKKQTDQYYRIRPLPGNLTGRKEEMVFNAAFLLPSSALERWLETAEQVRCEVGRKGLLLELSGPWPPYHFCPSLEL
jgi:hypothetical protein